MFVLFKTIIFHTFIILKDRHSWIPFEIFLSLNNDIYLVLMFLAIIVAWLFPGWDDISKPTFVMFLVFKEIEETSFVLTIISPILSKHFSRRFWDIHDLVLMLLIYFL